MPKRYYRRNLIRDSGEQAFDQAFENLHSYADDRQWHLVHGKEFGGDRSRRGYEFDFVVITNEGVVLVEVKGGTVAMRNGQLYQLADSRHPTDKPIEPNAQVQNNVTKLKKWLVAQGFENTLVVPMIAFPQSYHSMDTGLPHVWSRSTPYRLGEFLLEQLEAGKRRERSTRELSFQKQLDMATRLSPTSSPASQAAGVTFGAEVAERRKAENERILDGLQGNMRVMIQGPPGSGKSPYALRYMKRQASEGDQGLYLCWNELLAARLQILIANEELKDKVAVHSFFHFALKILDATGIDRTELNYQTLREPGYLRNLLKQAVESGNIPEELKYDYIVADECQDLFSLGIDKVLQACIRGLPNGLTHGQYLVLYDLTSAEETDLSDTYDQLLQSAAHYQLANHYRGTGGEGLNQFIEAVEEGGDPLKGKYGPDVQIVRFKDLFGVPHLVETTYRTYQPNKKFGEDAVLLLHSDYLSTDPQREDPHGLRRLRKKLEEQRSKFEHLVPENLGTPPTGLRYTSILKYKGLEKPIVFLVLPPELKWDQKMHHQLLVGASRASVRLCVLAPEGK
jgi:hypothetical protein